MGNIRIRVPLTSDSWKLVSVFEYRSLTVAAQIIVNEILVPRISDSWSLPVSSFIHRYPRKSTE